MGDGSWEPGVGGRVVGQTGFHTKFVRYALLSRILVRKECAGIRALRPDVDVDVLPSSPSHALYSTGLVHSPRGRPRPREGAEKAQRAQMFGDVRHIGGGAS